MQRCLDHNGGTISGVVQASLEVLERATQGAAGVHGLYATCARGLGAVQAASLRHGLHVSGALVVHVSGALVMRFGSDVCFQRRFGVLPTPFRFKGRTLGVMLLQAANAMNGVYDIYIYIYIYI